MSKVSTISIFNSLEILALDRNEALAETFVDCLLPGGEPGPLRIDGLGFRTDCGTAATGEEGSTAVGATDGWLVGALDGEEGVSLALESSMEASNCQCARF
jgi:hypothetical protein